MKPRFMIAAGLLSVLIVTMGAVAVLHGGRSTHLDFIIRDAVSGGWVWDASIVLQDRTIRSYYQSDRDVRTLRFTRLRPGNEVIRVSAPGYEARSVPVRLRRGANQLADPIDLIGTAIPDLAYFLVFETLEGADTIAELRPVNSEGTAVVNHPCLDLWIAARVSVQLEDGRPANTPSEFGASRGDELFRGTIEWDWDASPETVFRYSARIPGRAVKANRARYRVIDYLILLPNPGAGTIGETAERILTGWDGRTMRDLESVLDAHRDVFSAYVHTSWNVVAAE